MGRLPPTLLLILLLALSLRAWHLGDPQGPVFDEVHYLPTAGYMAGTRPLPPMGPWNADPIAGRSPDSRFEHPPLGKALIAGGIALVGDTEIGWRLPSLVFGMASLVLLYLLALQLWGSQTVAMTATLLLSLDTLHIVQSRLAMLDMFGMTLGELAVLAALHLRDRRRAWGLCLVSGAAIGGALSVKYANANVALALGVLLLWPHAAGEGPALSCRLKYLVAIYTLALAIVCSWFLWFSRYGWTFGGWVMLQKLALTAISSGIKPHPYGSTPPAWLFDGGHIWYAFTATADAVRGVIAWGNPVLWLAFLPAAFLLVRPTMAGTPRQRQGDVLAAVWFLATFLPFFAMLWRRHGFLYYMLPCLAPMTLMVARTLSASPRARAWTCGFILAMGAVTAALWPFIGALPVPVPYYLALLQVLGGA